MGFDAGRFSRRALLMALLSGLPPAAFAGPEAAAQVSATPLPSVSPSKRFVVSGADAVRQAGYARWADASADRLADLAAVRLPPGAFEIRLLDSSASGDDQVGAVESRRRLLTIDRRLAADSDARLSAFCGMMVGSWVEALRVGRDGARRAVTVPEWLPVGLARNLDAESRTRCRQLVKGWTKKDGRPSASAVLGWEAVPDGWRREGAMCGLFVRWMLAVRSGGLSNVLERLAAGGAVSPEWVAREYGAFRSVAELDLAWDEWMDRQDRIVQEFGALSVSSVEALKAETVVRVESADPDRAGASDYEPDALIDAARKSPALRRAAAERAQRIQEMVLGKAPELLEVSMPYALFFDGVSKGASRFVSSYRLRRADQAYARLISLTRAREAYVDAVERDLAPARGAEGTEAVLEKSAIETYVDDAERRWPSPR